MSCVTDCAACRCVFCRKSKLTVPRDLTRRNRRQRAPRRREAVVARYVRVLVFFHGLTVCILLSGIQPLNQGLFFDSVCRCYCMSHVWCVCSCLTRFPICRNHQRNAALPWCVFRFGRCENRTLIVDCCFCLCFDVETKRGKWQRRWCERLNEREGPCAFLSCLVMCCNPLFTIVRLCCSGSASTNRRRAQTMRRPKSITRFAFFQCWFFFAST